jgi:hypothetical protein
VSALSDHKTSQEEEFSASEYVRSLCANSKIVILNSAQIKFLPGWKSIVAQLLKSIKNYPIEISKISDFYSVLDVEFAVVNNKREVLVWGEISNAREQSKFICAQCSKDKLIRRSNNVANMLCEECSRNTGVLSKTGTWLDRY